MFGMPPTGKAGAILYVPLALRMVDGFFSAYIRGDVGHFEHDNKNDEFFFPAIAHADSSFSLYLCAALSYSIPCMAKIF
jgi:hypothetical protein|tara:strand:- start:298 stop:534 length:237 start_codon:yes stop_codon:yes gene_type:complete